MRLVHLAAAASLCVCSFAAANADVIYTYTGARFYAGTTFTVDAPASLSYSRQPVPVTTGGDFYLSGVDEGQILDAVFFSENLIQVQIASGSEQSVYFSFNHPVYSYDLSADGVYSDSFGDKLTISGAPMVSSTPEPSSFALLGTGILGVAGVLRRRSA